MSWHIISPTQARQAALILTITMDDTENVGGPYNKLVFEEELGTDEHTLYSNIERQQGTVEETWNTAPIHQQESDFVSSFVDVSDRFCCTK